MPVPDYADSRPAYLQIAEDLRAQIEAGKYRPGDRLPSNRVMSEQYGVATETLRQALDVLRADKLVATQSTRGTFVLRTTEHSSSEYEAVMSRIDEMAEDLRQLREEVAALRQAREA